MKKVNVYIGNMRSGKDTLAREHARNHDNHTFIAFADGVRETLWNLLGWKPETVEEYEKFKTDYSLVLKHTKNKTHPAITDLSLTGREVLQRLGTDALRSIDPDIWVKCAKDKIEKALDQDKTVFITDCRFENEAKMLFENFNCSFYYCRYNSGIEVDTSHESEQFATKFNALSVEHGSEITHYMDFMIK